MKVKIVAVGKIKEQYLKDAIAEYVKRISRFAKVEIIETEERLFNGVPNEKEIEKILAEEAKGLSAKAEGFVIALDIDGETLTSKQIAEKIDNAQNRFSTLTFLIGGSYGMASALKQSAALRLSFGKITLPHQLARVVACEQIYRAFTILNNVPYHK